MVAHFASMIANRFHFFGKLIVIGKQGSAVSKTTEWLGRKETRAGDRRDGTASFSVLGGSKTLGCILNHGYAMLGSNRVDTLQVRHLPKKADRHDCLGPAGDRRFELIDIHVVGGSLNIDKNRGGADLSNHLRGADPCERDGDHLIPCTYLKCSQGNFKAIRAACRCDAMLHAYIIRQNALYF